jgi:hypothetical protein
VKHEPTHHHAKWVSAEIQKKGSGVMTTEYDAKAKSNEQSTHIVNEFDWQETGSGKQS